MSQFLQRTPETPHTCSERPWKAKPSLPLWDWKEESKTKSERKNRVRKGNKVGGEKANSRLSTDSWLMGLVIFLMLCFLTAVWLFSGKKVSPSWVSPSSLSSTSNFILTSIPLLKSSPSSKGKQQRISEQGWLLLPLLSCSMCTAGGPVTTSLLKAHERILCLLRGQLLFQPYNISEKVEILRIEVWEQLFWMTGNRNGACWTKIKADTGHHHHLTSFLF